MSTFLCSNERTGMRAAWIQISGAQGLLPTGVPGNFQLLRFLVLHVSKFCLKGSILPLLEGVANAEERTACVTRSSGGGRGLSLWHLDRVGVA